MVFKYLPLSHAISTIGGPKKTLLNTLPADTTPAPSNRTRYELSIKTMIHQLVPPQRHLTGRQTNYSPPGANTSAIWRDATGTTNQRTLTNFTNANIAITRKKIAKFMKKTEI